MTCMVCENILKGGNYSAQQIYNTSPIGIEQAHETMLKGAKNDTRTSF